MEHQRRGKGNGKHVKIQSYLTVYNELNHVNIQQTASKLDETAGNWAYSWLGCVIGLPIQSEGQDGCHHASLSSGNHTKCLFFEYVQSNPS